ncbi:hypothetical protein UFOVP411_16 [uncultured Caudovirales phage]|uniref:Uncharacterized protein n=1 Tax=uncultured Caudovirales phage TaxID=2100421 RepID=A0A6J5M7D2_9CAUD|nr:hypothetical protein UFOVP411_16 [uncultured Caudovirales phage]
MPFIVEAQDKPLVVRFTGPEGLEELIVRPFTKQIVNAPAAKVAVLGLVDQPDLESPNGPGGE